MFPKLIELCGAKVALIIVRVLMGSHLLERAFFSVIWIALFDFLPLHSTTAGNIFGQSLTETARQTLDALLLFAIPMDVANRAVAPIAALCAWVS